MISLFNFRNTGTKEFRVHVPFLDPDESFAKLLPNTEKESFRIRALISAALYDRAQAHYQSNDFNQENQNNATLKILDYLVYLVQAPVSSFAYLSYAPNNDIVHSRNGRREHWDKDSKPATQWKVSAQEQELFKQAHEAINNLLSYIEENREVLTEWKLSAERKKQRGLFIQSADQWADVHPLGSDRWLFVKAYPFFKEYMDKSLASTLGNLYAPLKVKLEDNSSLEEADKILLEKCNACLGIYALVRVIKEMPLEITRSGINQNYSSDRMTLKASQVATDSALSSLSFELQSKLSSNEQLLELHIKSLLPLDDSVEEDQPEDDGFMVL